MKTLFIMLLSGLMVSSCHAQDIPQSKIPSVVINTVMAQYPGATDIDWKHSNNLYEAEIDMKDQKDINLKIDASGKLLMQKQSIPVTELMPEILAAVEKNYKEYRIDDADKIEKGGLIFYQVELDSNGKKDVHLVFNADGSLDKNATYWD